MAAQEQSARKRARARLTEQLLKNLAAPAKGNKVYYDAPDARGSNYTAGFGVRVTAGGHRSFVLNYRSKSGREGRITIGSPPEWSVTAARERAKEFKRSIDGGADPARDDREKRQADNINQLADQFIAEHVSRKRPATRDEYKAIIRKYVRPALGTKKVSEVDHSDIDRIHRKISERAPYRANRTVAVLSKMFNFAIRGKLRSDNPAQGVERNPEEKRERYLTDDETQRLLAALDAHRDQHAANVIRLLLLTGARRGETLAARWDKIDLKAGVWTKPGATTKQKTVHRVPLSMPALELLQKMRAAEPDAEMVFPDVDKEKLRRSVTAVLAASKITGFRTHDLRHNFASTLASAKQSLPIIGALLGQTQAQTTMRYAHLVDEALRQATEQAGVVLASRRLSK